MQYDSREIRQMAKEFRKSSYSVHCVGKIGTQQVRNVLGNSFSGSASDALYRKLDQLQDEVQRLGNGLNGIEEDLLAFARDLDRADQKAKSTING